MVGDGLPSRGGAAAAGRQGAQDASLYATAGG